ncbi:hypothetical protein ACHAW5_010664 [Stephanodiscus triporus]|uniref:Methyltransferase domain-containing protein n=1 Tax=Stephanodiscus triporus TaxID=2934178 RepID=A0ABD3NL44_9STRA
MPAPSSPSPPLSSSSMPSSPSPMRHPPPPPPLPPSLSVRLLSTIDPITGNCRHHPTIKLCELVQGGTRWVVRRKVCYRCGSRAPVVEGAAGGSEDRRRHHGGATADRRMPGRAVTKVDKGPAEAVVVVVGGGGGRSRSRSRRPPSRSASADRIVGGRGEEDDGDDGRRLRRRQRLPSTTRSASSSSRDVRGDDGVGGDDGGAGVGPSAGNAPSSVVVAPGLGSLSRALEFTSMALTTPGCGTTTLAAAAARGGGGRTQSSTSGRVRRDRRGGGREDDDGGGGGGGNDDNRRPPLLLPDLDSPNDIDARFRDDGSDPVIYVPATFDASAPLPNPAPRTPRETAVHDARRRRSRSRSGRDIRRGGGGGGGGGAVAPSTTTATTAATNANARPAAACEVPPPTPPPRPPVGSVAAVPRPSPAALAHLLVDADCAASGTSSISSASAKMRRADPEEVVVRHRDTPLPLPPECGVIPSEVDVVFVVGGAGRSGSVGRRKSPSGSIRPSSSTSRSHSAAPTSTSTRRALAATSSSSRELVVRPPSSSRRSLAERAAPDDDDDDDEVVGGGRTAEANVRRTRSASRCRSSDPLAASSARSARRNNYNGDASRSVSCRRTEAKVWDESGREVKKTTTTNTTTTRTGEGGDGAAPGKNGGSSKAGCDRRSSRPGKTRGGASGEGDIGGGGGGGKGGGGVVGVERRGAEGPTTRSSQSSVERARSSSNPVNSEDRGVAPAPSPAPSRARVGEDPDDIERKVIYKKRARRRRKEYDDDGNTVVKPMRIIELSSDEKSHASSISEGSGTDDDDDESLGVFDRPRNRVGDGGEENGRSRSRAGELAGTEAEAHDFMQRMLSTSPLLLFLLSSKTNERQGLVRKSHSSTSFLSIDDDGAAVEVSSSSSSSSSSRWRHRTAKRRRRTEGLLRSIEEEERDDQFFRWSSSSSDDDVPALAIPTASLIDWDSLPPGLDPTRGGGIRDPGGRRGHRKRAQVQAFQFLVETLIVDVDVDGGAQARGITVVDAGCGAGNLAIALAGLLANSSVVDGEGGGEEEGSRRRRRRRRRRDVRVLAVDVNGVALDRLSRRSAGMPGVGATPRTLRADLADRDLVLSRINPDDDVIVVSLHACGSASDMAMELAYRCGAPFVVCPCCTAKSLTRRTVAADEDDVDVNGARFSRRASSSSQRSGATADIEYPRSFWLRDKLSSIRLRERRIVDPNGGCNIEGGGGGGEVNGDAVPVDDDDDNDDDDVGKYYALLAKVADVGLGPQTPYEQREHQRRAKRIVELDRAMRAVERHGYLVRMVRIGDDGDPWGYGKGEVLVGARRGSAAAANLLSILPYGPMVIRIVRLTIIAATVGNNDRTLDLRVIVDAAVSGFSIVMVSERV